MCTVLLILPSSLKSGLIVAVRFGLPFTSVSGIDSPFNLFFPHGWTRPASGLVSLKHGLVLLLILAKSSMILIQPCGFILCSSMRLPVQCSKPTCRIDLAMVAIKEKQKKEKSK